MKGPVKITRAIQSGQRRRRQFVGVAGLVLILSTSGCHHRRLQPVLLPPRTPVALAEIPDPGAPPLVEAQAAKLPAVPTVQLEEKPRRVKKRTPKPAPAAQQPATVVALAPKKPVETASVAPPVKAEPAVAEIGALTVGGEQSPHALQQANELLASNERRLSSLSIGAVKAQAELVAKVRNFQKEAQQALTSGDAEGAQTLATKGKLLLDDLDKAGSP